MTGLVRRFGGIHPRVSVHAAGASVSAIVRHAETLSLRDIAAATGRRGSPAGIKPAADGARATITLGVFDTASAVPAVCPPTVAGIGIGRVTLRPAWDGQGFVPRKILSLGCAVDLRVVEAGEAGDFLACLRDMLEEPERLFL